MPLTTSQVVAAVRTDGLKGFTARKLERWANFGAILHPRRAGRGRGKGWQFLWSDDALTCAVLIANAFSWQKGRRLRDAALWAWLCGAPIPMLCVRRCLSDSYKTERHWLQRRLAQQRRHKDDEPLDLVDRVAHRLADRHKTLRAMGVSKATRLAAMQETIAQLVRKRWSENRGLAAENYKRLWVASIEKQGMRWGTDPHEVRRQQRFFEYAHLERLAGTATDEQWWAARHRLVNSLSVTAATMQRVAAGKRVSATARANAKSAHREHNMMFQLPSAWVAALMLYPVLKRKRIPEGSRPKRGSRR